VALYAFVETLPADTLVAAHPLDADAVPLRTRRSVLVSDVVALPFDHGYYGQVADRTAAALAACYASDWAGVDALGQRYGADVFLAPGIAQPMALSSTRRQATRRASSWTDPRETAFYTRAATTSSFGWHGSPTRPEVL
jgi:hypothetical protein